MITTKQLLYLLFLINVSSQSLLTQPLLRNRKKIIQFDLTTFGSVKFSSMYVKRTYLSFLRCEAEGYDVLSKYLESQTEQNYIHFKKVLSSLDSLYVVLKRECDPKIDQEHLRDIAKGIGFMKKFTIANVQNMSEENKHTYVLLSIGSKYGIQMCIDEYSDIIASFGYKWKYNKESFFMLAVCSKSVEGKFAETALANRFYLVNVIMVDSLNQDVDLDPQTDKFTIITDLGVQYRNIVLSPADQILVDVSLDEENKQALFNKVITIYQGAITPILLLFPSSVPSPDTWLRIVFESRANTHTHLLKKGILTRIQ